MINFKDSAQKATTLSELMANRDKISVEDIIKKYPGGVTIIKFDIISMFDNKKNQTTSFPVCLYKEDEDKYFFGGYILNKIVMEWVGGYEGDIQSASDDLFKSGGVKIKMTMGRTHAGNNLVNVEVM